MTKPQERALRNAINRDPPHYICPTVGVHHAAQDAVLKSLSKQGLITDEAAPVLTAKGRAVATMLLGMPQAEPR